MAGHQVQISAIVSEETRALLDQATAAHGLKKGHVIEEALLHYLHALRELASDVIIPSRLVLTETSGRAVVESVLLPREPTEAIRKASGRSRASSTRSGSPGQSTRIGA